METLHCWLSNRSLFAFACFPVPVIPKGGQCVFGSFKIRACYNRINIFRPFLICDICSISSLSYFASLINHPVLHYNVSTFKVLKSIPNFFAIGSLRCIQLKMHNLLPRVTIFPIIISRTRLALSPIIFSNTSVIRSLCIIAQKNKYKAIINAFFNDNIF